MKYEKPRGLALEKDKLEPNTDEHAREKKGLVTGGDLWMKNLNTEEEVEEDEMQGKSCPLHLIQ